MENDNNFGGIEFPSAETQEVAEPVTEDVNTSGAEDQEVADPVVEDKPAKTDTDSAFAEQRRAREQAEARALEAERQLEEFKAEADSRKNAFKNLTGNENADVVALAEQAGVDVEDVLAAIEDEQKLAKLSMENEKLNKQVEEMNLERMIDRDLKEVQAIDPSITDLSDLGDIFSQCIRAGLSAEDAYYAAKGKNLATKQTPPPEIGKVNQTPPVKTKFTYEEVQAMTPEQRKANAEGIMNSFSTWV